MEQTHADKQWTCEDMILRDGRQERAGGREWDEERICVSLILWSCSGSESEEDRRRTVRGVDERID